MMMLASGTVRPSSTSKGKRLSGHSAACSAQCCGSSGDNMQYSNGVRFSSSAMSAFWQ